MGKYRVTIEVEYIVEIDPEDTDLDVPAALMGDSPVHAVRRAMWVLGRTDIAHFNSKLSQEIHYNKRRLGVKRFLVRANQFDRVERLDVEPPTEP